MVDAIVVALVLADVRVTAWTEEPRPMAWALLAAAAIPLRRRLPRLVFALTLPSTLMSYAVMAGLFALYTLASLTRGRVVLALATAAYAACYALPWPLPPDPGDWTTAADVGYSLGLAAAPLSLGLMVQARRDLALRLEEVTEARAQERRLLSQRVLAEERARLAREMHDVVSHQVSLIAVRSGALQVSTDDAETREAARTIRRLSVRTLEELRHMVGVLRSGEAGEGHGPPPELTPQPTLAGLPQLVADCGIDAALEVDLPGDPPGAGLPAPVQRAVYRTVQEALTNVRKHAPGARAAVRVGTADGTVRVTVTNTAPTRPTLVLPSARVGLVGLRQRAQLLGGTLESGPQAGGYRLTLAVPATLSPTPGGTPGGAPPGTPA
ncbi:histidine kinase [Streptomyces sp. DSM 44917]|uniref:histidine kinase n=1 Tax=Streptomyces boetiae TaxID=3075541 RepID=A0ABU2LD44_9ACTN|nr:histidine kinase [Streptomyces sp. DSM 44917]MDT0309498.1 histidine kinase [Streptomyces sp. DSM 44917]